MTEAEFERRLQRVKADLTRQKDEELAKLNAQIKKEMDDKLRAERSTMKEKLGEYSRVMQAYTIFVRPTCRVMPCT